MLDLLQLAAVLLRLSSSVITHFLSILGPHILLRGVEALLAIKQSNLLTVRRTRGDNYASDPDSQEVLLPATSALCVRTSLQASLKSCEQKSPTSVSRFKSIYVHKIRQIVICFSDLRSQLKTIKNVSLKNILKSCCIHGNLMGGIIFNT